MLKIHVKVPSLSYALCYHFLASLVSTIITHTLCEIKVGKIWDKLISRLALVMSYGTRECAVATRRLIKPDLEIICLLSGHGG